LDLVFQHFLEHHAYPEIKKKKITNSVKNNKKTNTALTSVI